MIPRFYYPKYLSANEIVKRAGFVSAKKGMGYERDVKYGGTERLHCVTHEGRIDLHYDKPGGTQGHRVVRNHPAIGSCMEDFGRIDSAAATWWTRAARSISRPFKRTWEKW